MFAKANIHKGKENLTLREKTQSAVPLQKMRFWHMHSSIIFDLRVLTRKDIERCARTVKQNKDGVCSLRASNLS